MSDYSPYQDVNNEKKKPISFDVLLRRFFREIQQSRILSEARLRRFHVKKISRRIKRNSAQRKAVIRKIRRGY